MEYEKEAENVSKIIRQEYDRDLAHIIQTDNGSYYYVDSANTFDAGYETMVFDYDMKNDEVASWSDRFCLHYATFDQMCKGHFAICENFEKVMC